MKRLSSSIKYIFILSLLILFSNCLTLRYLSEVDDANSNNLTALVLSALLGVVTQSSATSAPLSLTYPLAPKIFTVNTVISVITPLMTGGSPTSCTSSPTLPSGLSLNATTCVLSGTPTMGTALNTYTITASNVFGSANGTISIRSLFSVPKYAYVSNSTANTISVYTVNVSNGDLTPGVAVASTSALREVAVDPTGRFLYTVGNTSSMVNLHSIDQGTGALSAQTQYVLSDTQPQTVEVHPSGKYLYTGTNNLGKIDIFSVSNTNGTLTSVASLTASVNLRSIKADPLGRFVYAVSGSGGNLIYSYLPYRNLVGVFSKTSLHIQK